ncbi:hypothetical protein [Streptomyces sp. NPDC058632]|uniref:hypothetical protein n=1 Tax=Streptomyces sp. NPDC058632 TaxID=3346567 RepID=UPI003668D13E
MSENLPELPEPKSQPEPEPESQPEPEPEPEAQTKPEETADKAVRRGRIAAVAGAVLLAAAVLGGTGYTVVTVRDADRDPGAPAWAEEKAERAGTERKAPAPGLAGMLVPYGTDDWDRGPDQGEFGEDIALDGERAAALRKERLNSLPSSARRDLEKEIDRQNTKGLAMRSFQKAEDSSWASPDDSLTVSIELVQLADRSAVRDIARAQTSIVEALDILRKGPKIEGHENAQCFLPPKDDEAKLESMYCTAYVGDVLVTAKADGGAPLETKEAAMLLRAQLDRIAEPGAAV